MSLGFLRRCFPCAPWWRDLAADRAFWGVLLVWACCWFSWILHLQRFASPLPWADEYAFVQSGVATHEQPVTWQFLWTPANEHRAPLTRLWCVVLGRLFNWDYRPMLQVDLALLAMACLSLMLSVRALRGRSHFCDAFLPLLILTSAHQHTLRNFVYAYAMTLAVWCFTASAVLVQWQRRSLLHLFVYVLGALVVTWGGGPAGNLWALGLCVPLGLALFGQTPLRWKVGAIFGLATTVVSSAFLIYTIPVSPPTQVDFRSDSWATTLKAAGKLSVGWMGEPFLKVLYPWALLFLLIPLLYVMVRFLAALYRRRGMVLSGWSELGGLLLTAGLVLVGMGQARGRSPEFWIPRYCALEIPFAVVLFLLLVRCAAPKTLMNCLAVGMAVCVGWNWPASINEGRALRPNQVILVSALRSGHEPLSLLVERYGDYTGWARHWGLNNLLGWWQQMRSARISAFAKSTNAARQDLFWHAESGQLASSLHTVDDPAAVNGHAVEAVADDAAGTAVYTITVPAEGVYKLCCRWRTPAAGHAFTVTIDGGPMMRQDAPEGPNYVPCVLEPGLSLTAGTHLLTITWPGAGSRLDVLELTRQ
jgi:hypothetical protein